MLRFPFEAIAFMDENCIMNGDILRVILNVMGSSFILCVTLEFVEFIKKAIVRFSLLEMNVWGFVGGSVFYFPNFDGQLRGSSVAGIFSDK